MKKLLVDMISESEFTAKAHGVHTAYIEMTQGLERHDGIDVKVNTVRKDADIIHVQTMGLYSLMKLRRSKAKKVISGHIIPASLVGSIKGMQYLQPFVRWYMRYFYNHADLVLAVSRGVSDEMKGPMRLKTRVEVMYNMIDMKKYARSDNGKQQARAELGIESSAFVVIGNGQVQPRKRLDTFFETARLLPDVTFVWVGGITFKHLGADYKSMQQLINSAPKNVTITGVIDHSKVLHYLHAADVFFLPAEQENHPMCVLEAAGAGLPILLRDIKEYDDTFRPDAVFIKSAKDAAEAIEKLRSDPTYYQAQQDASAKIADRFDSANGVVTLIDLYRELL